MSMREELGFQKALKDKIKSWKGTESFAASKTGQTKLNRTLDLLMGTNPEVLTRLGIDKIPNDPKDALNSVRNVDIKTVKDTEIFDLKGKTKLVGHHGTPASLLRALGVLKPDDQEYVFRYLKDLGVAHGMDPEGILSLDASRVHGKVAHGGDWSGRRTGASLEPIPGETGKQFIERFKGAYNIQMDQNERALLDPLTKDWDGAMKGATDALDLPNVNASSLTTPADQRSALTKILKPSAEQVRQVVESNPGNPTQIRKQAQEIVKNTPRNTQQQKLLDELKVNAKPSAPDLTPAQRFGRRRLALSGLAAAGLAAPSVLGTAASAAETGGRAKLAMETKNITDVVQTAISGLSLLADFVPGVGEFISTPADLTNTMIDQHRAGGSQFNGSGRGGGVQTATVGTNTGPRGRSGAKRALLKAN